MKRFINFIVIMALFISSISCEQYVDPVIEETFDSRELLQQKEWLLVDYQVNLDNSDIGAPQFLGFDNDSIEAGNYNLQDLIDTGNDFPLYQFKFTTENKILIDSTQSGNYLDAGKYLVFTDVKTNISPIDFRTMHYQYYYDESEKTMTFTLDQDGANHAIEDVDKRYINSQVNETPQKIGNAVADALGNPIIHHKIHNLLVDKLADKIQDWLNEWDPAVAPINLAEKIFEFFKDNDIQGELDFPITNVIKELFDFDRDTDLTGKRRHQKLSSLTIDNIFDHPDFEYGISTERMAALIAPVLPNQPVVNPQQISEDIIDAIGPVIDDIFTPERISKIVAKVINNHLSDNLKVANNFEEVTITLKHE